MRRLEVQTVGKHMKAYTPVKDSLGFDGDKRAAELMADFMPEVGPLVGGREPDTWFHLHSNNPEMAELMAEMACEGLCCEDGVVVVRSKAAPYGQGRWAASVAYWGPAEWFVKISTAFMEMMNDVSRSF